MKELDDLLGEMTIPEPVEETPEAAEPAEQEDAGKKKRSRGGKKKKEDPNAEPEAEAGDDKPKDAKDIAAIMAAKMKGGPKKKKTASEIAAAEAKARSAKQGKTKDKKKNYNEMGR